MDWLYILSHIANAKVYFRRLSEVKVSKSKATDMKENLIQSISLSSELLSLWSSLEDLA